MIAILKQLATLKWLYIAIIVFSPLNVVPANSQPDQTEDKETEQRQPVNIKQENQEDDELLELLALLEEETEIATKNKMNSDYVPGMVTVLHSEQMEALGVRNVAEALSLVPGLQMARYRSGEPSAKVRGFSYPFNAGNIKVMLNSIALSRESSGINSSVLLTPIEQVERIEVIRGPGSILYGDFAMAGVVNIITKSEEEKIFVRSGNDGSTGGGMQYSHFNEENSFGVGINFSITDDGENSAAEGLNPEEERSISVVDFVYKDFSFTIEGVHREIEFQRPSPPSDSNGNSNPPHPPGSSDNPRPPPSNNQNGDDRTTTTEFSWVMEARQKLAVTKDFGLEAYLSYLDNDFDSEVPRSFEGDRIEAGIEGDWKISTKHRALIQLTYAKANIDRAEESAPPGSSRYIAENIERSNYSLGFQDQFSLNDRFTLTAGLRYDYYDDVGDHITPRVAAVMRLREHHVLKAQYSEGFRAPTVWELYRTGDESDDLDYEVLETAELSYIFKKPRTVFRTTLYHSEIDNGIYSRSGQSFDNSVTLSSEGIELEWEQRLSNSINFLANVSYTDSTDERGEMATNDDEGSPGISEWLANLAIFWKLHPKCILSGRWLHVGERYSSDGGVDGYNIVDLTFTYNDLFLKGLSLKGGVKNILDDEIVYTVQHRGRLDEDIYSGQTFWMQLSYNF